MSQKPKVRLTTIAVVVVKVRVEVGSWGPDCKLDQVYRQAEESARGKIRNAMEKSGARFSFVGNAEVQAITTDMERTQ